MQVASMLHPRSSGSLGCLGNSARIQVQWLLERRCLFIVTGEPTLLRLPSRIEAVNEAAATVARLLKDSGITEDVSYGIDMAVREAVTNAVLHGNRQDESKFVELHVKISRDAVEIQVHDQGSGFKPEDVPDPTEAPNILKSSGRGIFFMRNFMDQVDWLIKAEGGTTVNLMKRL
jgi:serine/threonine-protein kinase RsbW